MDTRYTRLRDLPPEAERQARALILDSWVKGYYDFRLPMDLALIRQAARDDVMRVPPAVYKRYQRDLALRLLDEDEVIVATSPDDLHLFRGWVCRKVDVLHYVWVKESWRRLGIASRLIDGCQTTTHHPTYRHVLRWLKALGIEYNPYLLMR